MAIWVVYFIFRPSKCEVVWLNETWCSNSIGTQLSCSSFEWHSWKLCIYIAHEPIQPVQELPVFVLQLSRCPDSGHEMSNVFFKKSVNLPFKIRKQLQPTSSLALTTQQFAVGQQRFPHWLMNFPWLHFSGDAVADRAIGVRSGRAKSRQ